MYVYIYSIQLCMVHVRFPTTYIVDEYMGMLHSNICLKVPSRVINVSVTTSVEDGNLTLNVFWTTPQSDLPITTYEVEIKSVAEVMSVTLSGSLSANSTILTGLGAGVEYIVRVRALSEIGAGKWSEEQRVRTDDSECLGSICC